MNNDWYDKQLNQLHQTISEVTGTDLNKVKEIYSYLVEVGLIDYDVEKELFWDWEEEIET